MNNMELFESVIEYIEKHLEEKIEVSILAGILGVSIYEFRRIFSFVAGVPLSDYIRKRRLSLAAYDLFEKNNSVTRVAMKWGYDSPSSFSRAFKEFHGCSPNEAERTHVKMYSKLSVFSAVSGGNDYEYKIVKRSAFSICGITGISNEKDTECCENVWQKFYDEEKGLIEKSQGKIYAIYKNKEDFVECMIGIESEKSNECDFLTIPESLWACFKVKDTIDKTVNGIYSGILTEWAKSGNVNIRKDMPNVEVFPSDMESDDFEWEIMIPIERNDR